MTNNRQPGRPFKNTSGQIIEERRIVQHVTTGSRRVLLNSRPLVPLSAAPFCRMKAIFFFFKKSIFSFLKKKKETGRLSNGSDRKQRLLERQQLKRVQSSVVRACASAGAVSLGLCQSVGPLSAREKGSNDSGRRREREKKKGGGR